MFMYSLQYPPVSLDLCVLQNKSLFQYCTYCRDANKI